MSVGCGNHFSNFKVIKNHKNTRFDNNIRQSVFVMYIHYIVYVFSSQYGYRRVLQLSFGRYLH